MQPSTASSPLHAPMASSPTRICGACSLNYRKPKPSKTSRRCYPSTPRQSRQGRTYPIAYSDSYCQGMLTSTGQGLHSIFNRAARRQSMSLEKHWHSSIRSHALTLPRSILDSFNLVPSRNFKYDSWSCSARKLTGISSSINPAAWYRRSGKYLQQMFASDIWDSGFLTCTLAGSVVLHGSSFSISSHALSVWCSFARLSRSLFFLPFSLDKRSIA